MIIGNVLGYPIDTLVQRTERYKTTAAAAEERPAVASRSPEFDTVLQPLAAPDSTSRTEPAKPLPEDDESVRDRSVAAGTTVDGDTRATAALSTALDSVRYGMIADASTGEPQPDTAPSPEDVLVAEAVLERITARQTASAEELLAANDLEGALARSTLGKLLANDAADDRLSRAATAASAALAAALNASAANVTAPINDTAALDPELRTRLARVIERMQSEFGHDVTVVETARSQERQDYLYAQGRNAGGNIVTWTTDSAHTQGEAADVVVDGSWQNPAGFARLQQIAKEEGLRTLGMRDPGHLELPKDAWTTNGSARIVSATATAGSMTGGIAGVATVASVAPVATSASAAQPGASGAPGLVPPDGTASASNAAPSSRQDNTDSEARRGNNDAERARAIRCERGNNRTPNRA